MIKLLIIDQCKSYRTRLISILVDYFPEIKILSQSENYLEAEKIINIVSPDIIASELIEYEPNSKIKLLELKKNNPQAIFILMSNLQIDIIKSELDFADLYLSKDENINSIISIFKKALSIIRI